MWGRPCSVKAGYRVVIRPVSVNALVRFKAWFLTKALVRNMVIFRNIYRDRESVAESPGKSSPPAAFYFGYNLNMVGAALLLLRL